MNEECPNQVGTFHGYSTVCSDFTCSMCRMWSTHGIVWCADWRLSGNLPCSFLIWCEHGEACGSRFFLKQLKLLSFAEFYTFISNMWCIQSPLNQPIYSIFRQHHQHGPLRSSPTWVHTSIAIGTTYWTASTSIPVHLHLVLTCY